LADNDKNRLTSEEVKHIAHLARLELMPGDINRFSIELSDILNYIDILQDFDAHDVDPTFFTAPLFNVLRKDEPGHSLPVEDALANAPLRQDHYFKAPRILNIENSG